MKKQNPINIVMTPVRNEAWVLRAFLSANTQWADYIIIADQMSTDGSRDIYKEFMSNAASDNYDLIVIDNNNPEFNEAERQAMLVKKAREVAAGRDTLLWGLDADEILPPHWQETDDGKHILNSSKGDVFWFRWAQLSPDKKHFGDSPHYPWLFHDDGVEPHGNYVRDMHSMRIPYPASEKQMYYVKDFRVLHCGLLDPNRVAAKNRFYQFVDWELHHRSPVALSKAYGIQKQNIQKNGFSYLLQSNDIDFDFDFWKMIEVNSTHSWFDDYVYDRLSKLPIKDLRKLDIWDDNFMKFYKIEDKRRLIDKLIHKYFHLYANNTSFIIRCLNKILKWVY